MAPTLQIRGTSIGSMGMRHEPADNRHRINPDLIPLVDEYRKMFGVGTRTAAINSMIVRAMEAVRAKKPNTTPR